MNVRIEVKNRDEAKQILAGLNDPAVRAFVKVMGILSRLPSDRARDRVLRYTTEMLADQEVACRPSFPCGPCG